MGYSYEAEKSKLFTDDGQRLFLRGRDAAQQLLKEAGAFREMEWERRLSCTYDGWAALAILDRMIELGELVRWERPSWAQYVIYTTPDTHNY